MDIINEFKKIKQDNLTIKLWNLRKKKDDQSMLSSISVPKKNIFDLRIKAVNIDIKLAELNKCVLNFMIKDFATKYHS